MRNLIGEEETRENDIEGRCKEYFVAVVLLRNKGGRE